MDFRRVPTNGLHLHVAEAGPGEGPLAVLLHGFPEFWYGWRRQIPFLARAGFRVWAPDQRGYNLSDKPRPVAAYALDNLAADVVGLIDAAGRERAFLVGHDWGAAVAWWAAIRHPRRVERLVAINVPHPGVMYHRLRRDPSQLLRSWYIFFFQVPWLPEALARLDNFAALARTLRTTSRPGTFTDADLDEYRRAWARPNAYRSMLNWYRAIFRIPAPPLAKLRVRVPTLLIWGARDKFLRRASAEPSIELCDDGRLVVVEEATHWVQHEEPDRVNGLIDAFLRGREPPG